MLTIMNLRDSFEHEALEYVARSQQQVGERRRESIALAQVYAALAAAHALDARIVPVPARAPVPAKPRTPRKAS
jgi:hypothetical protein